MDYNILWQIHLPNSTYYGLWISLYGEPSQKSAWILIHERNAVYSLGSCSLQNKEHNFKTKKFQEKNSLAKIMI